jgi:predicted MPP superfamily phosphohydrolase
MIAAVALIFYSYLGLRLTERWWEWVVLLIPFALVLLFPSNRDRPLFLNIAFICMGLISFLFLFTLLRDIALLFKQDVSRNAVFVLAVVAVGLGFFKATFGIRIARVKVPVQGLPASLDGFRIAQLSDLHIGPTIGKKFVTRVVEKVNREKPDLIALTGDIGDGEVSSHLEDSGPLRRLTSRYGTYYVTGNHEYYWNAGAWMKRFQELGFHVLMNSGKDIVVGKEKILVAGVPDPMSRLSPDPITPLKNSPFSSVRILLSHRPEVVTKVEDWGYDLILAGHTHGGQFFPWTLVASFAHEFYLGLYKLRKGHLYVSAGTGSWGPLIRLGTTPEITILELRASK